MTGVPWLPLILLAVLVLGVLLGLLLANERQVAQRMRSRPLELDFTRAAARGELDLLDWRFPVAPAPPRQTRLVTRTPW